MLDNYLKTNPGVKDLPQLRIELQSLCPQSDAITIRPRRPQELSMYMSHRHCIHRLRLPAYEAGKICTVVILGLATAESL